MSLADYQQSRHLAAAGRFYSLIMAAMRQADTLNAARLREAFPDVWDELQRRYNEPGGFIPGDPGYEAWQRERERLLEPDPEEAQ